MSLAFTRQSYFAVPKNIRLKFAHIFKQIALFFNHLLDIDSQYLMNLYKKIYCKIIFLLVIDTTLALNNLLYFRKNLLGRI